MNSQKQTLLQIHKKQYKDQQQQQSKQKLTSPQNLKQQSLTIKKQTIQQKTTITSHKLFSVKTDICLINIEVISLIGYKWIIISQSNTLKIDGSLQLAMKTPFQDKPTVLDIGADQHQAQTNDFCSKLSKTLACPIILSMNLSPSLTINDQRNLIKFLTATYSPDQSKEQIATINSNKSLMKTPPLLSTQPQQK